MLVALLDIPPFVATLGTLGIAQGLSLLVTDGQSVVGIPPRDRATSIPAPLARHPAAGRHRSARLSRVVHALLYHTRFGTYVFALGGNREALRVAGVSVARHADPVYAFGGADGRLRRRC